ncbi:hypothetical protein MEO93_29585, partial [Dolichospermum sp. ST_sed3]|nr:hypothetical protein [Dolichospermum sp. ST_sed3]
FYHKSVQSPSDKLFRLFRHPVRIKQSLSLLSTDIIKGLQSLTRRFLLTKLENDQKLYTLSSVFREYLRIYHQ